MYFLKGLIIIIKLLVVILAIDGSSVSRSVINSIKDIYHQLSVSSASPISTATNVFRLHKRHHKRHSNLFDYYSYNENSTVLEWSNPCGGEYQPDAQQPKRSTIKEKKKIYNNLRRTALNDLNFLNDSSRQAIDISNINIWWLHNATYKFLPKLKSNSTIAPKRWYRNMQTYVASFSYLYRILYTYDRSKSQRESKTSQELRELTRSARNILCELETAMNKTLPAKKRQIPQITRLRMNTRLKLRTQQRLKENGNALSETDSIDLKFVKFFYFEYLQNICQLLKKYNKRKNQVDVQIKVSQQEQQQFKNSTLLKAADSPLNINKTKRNNRRGNPRSKRKSN